jgi:streptogramin lyase
VCHADKRASASLLEFFERHRKAVQRTASNPLQRFDNTPDELRIGSMSSTRIKASNAAMTGQGDAGWVSTSGKTENIQLAVIR